MLFNSLECSGITKKLKLFPFLKLILKSMKIHFLEISQNQFKNHYLNCIFISELVLELHNN